MGKILDKLLSLKVGLPVLVILNLIDAVSTHAALTLGIATEANPIMAWAWSVGPWMFWVMKMMATGSALALVEMYVRQNERPRPIERVVLFLNGLYVLVVGSGLVGWALYLGSL
jgi:Domain of unknown function (DUF5658)